MNKFLMKVVVSLGIGLFLMACNFVFSGAGISNDTQVPAKSGDYLQLPLRPDVPPADVLQQISLHSVGGGGMATVCENRCIYLGENTIALTYFMPNQTLIMAVYSPYEYPSYEFLTEVTIQTDNNGAFELHIDRDPEFLLIVLSDQRGNIVSNDEWLRIDQNTPTCTGQFESRLAVGMHARVNPANTEPVQLRSNFSQNPDRDAVDIDENFEIEIMGGPQCNEGMTWWRALAFTKDDSGMPHSGWVAEGNPNTWYIEPIK